MLVLFSVRPRLSFLIVFAVAFYPVLQAQPTVRSLCFRDNGPGCRTFLVTEAAILHSLNNELFDAHLNVEVGVLHKSGERWAYGGTLNMIYDESQFEAFLLAVKPRIRYWINDKFRADIALGAALFAISNDDSYYRLRLPDFTGTLSVGYRDWVSIILQLEMLRFRYPQSYSPLLEPMPPDIYETNTNWYLGVNFGSIPGAILVPLVTVGAILVEYADDHWD